jgi:Transmembrane family 220, helix
MASTSATHNPDEVHDGDVEADAGLTSVDDAVIGTENEKVTSQGEVTDPEIKTYGRSVKKFILIIISVALMILWVYSAIVQGNDADNSLVWKFFYVMHAVCAGIFVVVRLFFADKGEVIVKPFASLLVLMAIWSVVLIVISSIARSGAKEGGSEEGGDAPQFTDSEEKSLEIAGAALCLASALYHLIVLKCCF